MNMQEGRACAPRAICIGWGERWHNGKVSGIGAHVKLQNYQRYLVQECSTSETIAGKEEHLLGARDWGRIQLLKGARWGPRRARRDSQVMHNLLPTRKVTARREYPCTHGAECLHDGDTEDQWHVVGLCGHPMSCRERQKMGMKMHGAIDSIRCDEGARALLRSIYHEENGLLGRERLEQPVLGGDEQERAADAV